MPKRFKEARLMKKMKTVEVAELLGVSQPTLSAWETGRKSPTTDNLVALADLYRVTTDYLLGRDSIDGSLPVQEIPVRILPFFHGKPVWSARYGWGIVNATEQTLIFVDKQIPLSNVGGICRIPLPFSESDIPIREPLTHDEIKLHKEIWLEPISDDQLLREELRGWYAVKDRYVENDFGQRFYFGTYGAKWLGFEKQNKK